MTEVGASLRERRTEVEELLDRTGLLHTLSAARMQLARAISTAITHWASGQVLEAGSGRSPYAETLATAAGSITSLDVDPSHTPDVVGDVQDMSSVPDSSFDTVVSTQVLEHLPRPQVAFAEFARVLRPGGILILTAPHLSMIHDAPHDYFRYTRFGLSELCQTNSFEVIELKEIGGLVSLIGHTASVALLTTVGGLPGLFWPTWVVNYVLLVRLLDVLDNLVGLRSILPRDHLLVARRA